jgi:hypothetical protein
LSDLIVEIRRLLAEHGDNAVMDAVLTEVGQGKDKRGRGHPEKHDDDTTLLIAMLLVRRGARKKTAVRQALNLRRRPDCEQEISEQEIERVRQLFRTREAVIAASLMTTRVYGYPEPIFDPEELEKQRPPRR